MHLHTLYASGNPKITNEGIKHMQLHTLDASNNPKITDEGIKHMPLLHYMHLIIQTYKKIL